MASRIWQRAVAALFGHSITVCSALGALLMVAVGHPVLETLHLWRSGEVGEMSAIGAVVHPLVQAFSVEMLPMTFILALIGACVGGVAAWLHARMTSRALTHYYSERTFEDVQTLIAEGESESLEFKSSLRWDWGLGKVNKVLEGVIAKTLCGMMNQHGGILLIGVEDSGAIRGIEKDCQTLRHQNLDGFEQRIVALATKYLGGHSTGFIRTEFVQAEGKSISIIRIAPSREPVFCKDGNLQRYYVRAGNTTRELDTREAIAHIHEKSGG
jgi:hypothetical protein